MSQTNLDRALNGRDLAASALTADGQGDLMGLEDYESGLIDALTNLQHFARRYNIDFDNALRIARNHHDHEKAHDWEAAE